MEWKKETDNGKETVNVEGMLPQNEKQKKCNRGWKGKEA
jgi:hypothetical protein